MKKMIFSLIIISLLCLGVMDVNAQRMGAMKDTFIKLNQEMVELSKAGKYESLQKFYEDDVISLPYNRPMEKGFNEVLAGHQMRRGAGYKLVDGQMTTVELIAKDDLVVEIGTFVYTVSFPGPPEPITDNGKYMTIWRMQKDNSWKIAAETWNSDKGQQSQQRSGSSQQEPGQFPSTIQQAPDTKTQDGR
ncbi:MAG: nuclear transport factor 2 family protein [Bacteroidales bacterium]